MPVADWSAHRSDTSYIFFRRVFDLMDRADTIEAQDSLHLASKL